MAAATARGVIYIHSAPRALCPHVEWAAGRALDRAVNFDWVDQPVLKGSMRTEFYWEGEQGAPKFFAFNLHPFVSGVPFRTKIIDEFIRYAKGFPKVWFARRIEIANWCLEKGY